MTAASPFTVAGLMHGQDYSGQACNGWVAQRKWDGVFALWDGEALWTREGNAIEAPLFFTACLPREPLCCELTDGGEGSDLANGLLKWQGDPARWRMARLHVFDAPRVAGGLVQRMRLASRLVETHPYAEAVAVFAIGGREDLRAELRVALDAHWEGLMIQPADHSYEPGRSSKLLKVKREALHVFRTL